MKVLGAIFVILALVVGILPQFSDCQSQGKAITLANGKTIPMKCHWTAKAEMGVAVPLVAVGGMTLFTRRKESKRVLALVGVLLGALVISLPTWLIGVCTSDMPCNTIMRPALILTGIIIVAISIAWYVLSGRGQENPV